jgi:hypothetical protein
MKKKIRPLGQIMNDIEPLLLEMTENQDLEWYEVMNLIYGYLQTHCSGQEIYIEDNSHPVFYYGHRKGLK